MISVRDHMGPNLLLLLLLFSAHVEQVRYVFSVVEVLGSRLPHSQ